ncbi:hypothetical protein LXL04_039768 [Taraxacum kok-saghyz]
MIGNPLCCRFWFAMSSLTVVRDNPRAAVLLLPPRCCARSDGCCTSGHPVRRYRYSGTPAIASSSSGWQSDGHSYNPATFAPADLRRPTGPSAIFCLIQSPPIFCRDSSSGQSPSLSRITAFPARSRFLRRTATVSHSFSECMLMGFPATPLPPATVAMVAVGGDRYCISRLRSCVLEIVVPDVVIFWTLLRRGSTLVVTRLPFVIPGRCGGRGQYRGLVPVRSSATRSSHIICCTSIDSFFTCLIVIVEVELGLTTIPTHGTSTLRSARTRVMAACGYGQINHHEGSLTTTRGTCTPTCRSSESEASGSVCEMVVMPHPCTLGWPGSRVANGFGLWVRGRLGEMGNLLGRQSPSYDIELKHESPGRYSSKAKRKKSQRIEDRKKKKR